MVSSMYTNPSAVVLFRTFSTGDLKMFSSAKQNENLHGRPPLMTSANPAENGVDTFLGECTLRIARGAGRREKDRNNVHVQFTQFLSVFRMFCW